MEHLMPLNSSQINFLSFINHTEGEACTYLIGRDAFEISVLIALSHILHVVFKRCGQPSHVSQMLAGFLLGPIIIRHFKLLNTDTDQLENIGSTVTTLFMFLAGLEIDFTCLYRTIHSTVVIVGSSVMAFVPISILGSAVFYSFTENPGNKVLAFVFMFIMFVNTASPTLMRVVNEHQLTMTEIGRVAMSVALITDFLCLVILGMISFAGIETLKGKKLDNYERYITGGLVILLWAACAIAIRFTVKRTNKLNMHRGFVGINVVVYLLLLVFMVSLLTAQLSYDPKLCSFIFGIAIQKEGPTARTLIEKLSHIIYTFMLPIYFGVAILQVHIHMFMDAEVFIMVATMVLLGMGGKIGGTIIGAKYIGMSMNEAMVLSSLLNVKGHVNLMIIIYGKNTKVWDDKTYMALLLALFINSNIAFPTTTYFVSQMRRTVQYNFRCLEWLHPESELRILACIHSPIDLPMILDLIEISCGPNKSHYTPYILHLRELSSTISTTMLYHQLRDDDINNNAEGNPTRQVNVIVDKYIQETNIRLSQLYGISCFESMHKELTNGVQEVHASIAIVPFHRKQRFDGKMGIGNADIRQFNVNVLQHASCTIGILVDRGMNKRWGSSANSYTASSLTSDDNMILDVVVMFLGGADDREAVAYAGRLALHSCVHLTLVRFVPTFKHGGNVSCFSNPTSRTSFCQEADIENNDETFMSNFHARFVATDMVKYTELMVANSKELIEELSSMKGMYTLYIVGQQTQGSTAQLTGGMKEWEESPELGSIGDLLTQSDFMTEGSVLVIHQCKKDISPILG